MLNGPFFIPHLLILLLFFAPAEAEAIPSGTLTVAQSRSYQPYAYLDHDEIPHGYLVDFWNHFAEVNDVIVEFQLDTWANSLKAVKNGSADIHGGLFYSDERAAYLDFGPAITTVKSYLYVRKGVDDYYDSLPVGVTKGGYAEYHMRRKYPDRKIVQFDSTKGMVRSAGRGEIDVFLADQPTAIYAMRQSGIEDSFLPKREMYRMELQVAWQKDRQDIAKVIRSGWGHMDEKKLAYLYSRWFLDKEEEHASWKLHATLVAVLGLVIAQVIRMMGRRTQKTNDDESSDDA